MVGESEKQDDRRKKEKSSNQFIVFRQSNGEKMIHYIFLFPLENTVSKNWLCLLGRH
jgi:hypothetical protein